MFQLFVNIKILPGPKYKTFILSYFYFS